MIAEGVRDNGLGDGGGMLFGMNLASALNPQNGSVVGATEPSQPSKIDGASLDDKIETLKKLKDLLDVGILSQEEFDAKKREILGL